jgi:hypothetical protein
MAVGHERKNIMTELFAAIAAQIAGSGAIAMGIARFSPWVGPRLRHAMAGVLPLAMPFAWMLEGRESVTLHGSHLAVAAGLALGGAGLSRALTGMRGRTPRVASGERGAR